MKVLVVGYGSMGRRRIRLLRRIEPDDAIYCVENNPERKKQAGDDGNTVFSSLEEGIAQKPEVAFVCTSPGYHAEIVEQLVYAGINVFTELNLVSSKYEELIELAKQKNTVIFMSSTLLYNKSIEKIDGYVKKQTKPVTYIYHIGQYLPDWHPWESYKDFFIGRKDTNGVREIYAIQLPWIINTFGKVKSLSAVQQKCTDLDINFNDSIITTMVHENGNIGTFIADIVSRKATTSLEVIGEDLHLFWHGHNDDLFVYDPAEKKFIFVSAYDSIEHMDGYADNIIENQYLDEIRDFLSVVKKHTTPRYSLEKDRYTLSLIDEIEGKDT